jgi:hypothetical protein
VHVQALLQPIADAALTSNVSCVREVHRSHVLLDVRHTPSDSPPLHRPAGAVSGPSEGGQR